ncbi:MAG TPA: NUDIX domain-containing protein [Chloroflexota bacterium]|nr:NUDIX domain-containing protein [Chloroflexota bacterium]
MSSSSVSLQQNDPTELLEVFDAAGQPTGVAKSRASIHLAGDWHQAFHCWIVRQAGSEIVLQRRSFVKDTFGGLWDASAAGHWRYGETAQEAAREIAEELGLDVDFRKLTYRGREVSERVFPNGLTDREHHQVYVLDSDLPLSAYRPDPREVIGVAAFPAAGLVAVLSGTAPRVAAVEAIAVALDGQVSAARLEVSRAELVPYSAERIRGMLGWA